MQEVRLARSTASEWLKWLSLHQLVCGDSAGHTADASQVRILS